MTRALLALALCACAPDYGPRLAQLEAEGTQLRAKLVEANGQLRELAKQVDDVRALSLIGGPRRRYKVGVDCNDGPHVPGSFGEAAHRALFASGWCPGQVLPVPNPVGSVLQTAATVR